MLSPYRPSPKLGFQIITEHWRSPDQFSVAIESNKQPTQRRKGWPGGDIYGKRFIGKTSQVIVAQARDGWKRLEPRSQPVFSAGVPGKQYREAAVASRGRGCWDASRSFPGTTGAGIVHHFRGMRLNPGRGTIGRNRAGSNPGGRVGKIHCRANRMSPGGTAGQKTAQQFLGEAPEISPLKKCDSPSKKSLHCIGRVL